MDTNQNKIQRNFLLKLKRFYEKNMQISVTVSRAKDLMRDVTQQQQHKEKVWGC